MADTIRAPWILDYLINIAEEYGGDLASVPRPVKPFRAQIIKFLTFPPPDSKEPCVIWADVSDKKHFIHARLSLEAMQRYMQSGQYTGPLTSHKSAMVRLIRIRPAFARVARRDGNTGMTDHLRIFLDVDEFELLGACGEPAWGSPVDVAQNADIREWMLGLQQDGGGGNVLKLKKQQRMLAIEHTSKLRETHAQSHHQATIDSMELKVRVARQSAAHKARPSSNTVRQRPIADKEAVRRASWKRLHTNMKLYLCPSDSVFQQFVLIRAKMQDDAQVCRVTGSSMQDDIARCPPSPLNGRTGVQPNTSQTPSPSHEHNCFMPQTPSHWSPSVKESPSPRGAHEENSSDTEEEAEHDEFVKARESSTDEVHHVVRDIPSEADSHPGDINPSATDIGEGLPEGSERMPPPARRTYTTPVPTLPMPSASSPLRATSPNLRRGFRDHQHHELESLPPSSFPPSTHPHPHSPISSPQPNPVTPAYPVPAVRRVPPPQCDFLPRHPDASGDGRILVENSDTASPGSHRCSQSQSQGASQSSGVDEGSRAPRQSQSQSQSQPHKPSQLRQVIEPVSPGRQHSASLPGQSSSHNLDHDAQASNSAEQAPEEDPQPRTQQSLSYKGDSQSQEHAQVNPVDARTEGQPSLDGICPPDIHNSVIQNKSAPVVGGAHLCSPMLVDSGEPPEDVPSLAVGTTPGWVAMKAVDSSEDSPTEVDELLSDPAVLPKHATRSTKPKRTISTQQKPLPMHRQTANPAEREQEGQIDKTRMDSDDEKTASMVDRYVDQSQWIGHARKRSLGGEMTGLHNKPPVSTGGETTQTPNLGDTSEMCGTRSVARSKAHDPSVWAAPTFMRNRGNSKVSDASSVKQLREMESILRSPVPPTVPRLETKVAKRKLSSPSTSEQSPVKKRKLSGVALPVAASTPHIHTPDQKVRATVSRHASSLMGASTATSFRQRPSMSRPVWTSKPARSSKITSPPPRFSTPPIQYIAQRVEDPPARESAELHNVKYVDLRSASRSSSRTSSRVSNAAERPSHPPRDPSTSSVPERRSSAKGKNSMTSSASSSRADLGPVSGLGSLGAAAPKPTARADSAVVSSGQASCSTSAVPYHGYDSSLELTRTPGGPPLLGWHDLLDILLKTGRARHKELKRRD
ncbi:hypothetical protein C8Q73DRAFT_699460 [Cubamyces lactineus]|nr:hypothetical protein C8Q73DRAFT_699460 [Cubamyces lactineus]